MSEVKEETEELRERAEAAEAQIARLESDRERYKAEVWVEARKEFQEEIERLKVARDQWKGAYDRVTW